MRKLINALEALRRPAVIVAALALAPGAAELDAQAAPGDTVRITTGRSKGVYQLQAIRRDTVFVQEYGATLGIPLSRVDRIEVGTRRGPERILAGGLIGAGIGTTVGAILGAASGDDCDGTGWCFGWSAEEKATGGAVILGAIGGISGLIVGAKSPWSWKRVGPDDLLAIRAAPAPDGLSLRVSFKPARSTPRARPEPAMNPVGHGGDPGLMRPLLSGGGIAARLCWIP